MKSGENLLRAKCGPLPKRVLRVGDVSSSAPVIGARAGVPDHDHPRRNPRCSSMKPTVFFGEIGGFGLNKRSHRAQPIAPGKGLYRAEGEAFDVFSLVTPEREIRIPEKANIHHPTYRHCKSFFPYMNFHAFCFVPRNNDPKNVFKRIDSLPG